MSDLIPLKVPYKLSYLEQAEITGKKLYKQNKNYRNLANCFEHPEFREFFDTYFSNENDIKVILVFMKLYKEIEKSSPIELNGYQKLSILDSLVKNRDFRRQIYNKSINDMKFISVD